MSTLTTRSRVCASAWLLGAAAAVVLASCGDSATSASSTGAGGWHPTGPMDADRAGAAVTALADGRVLLVGGAQPSTGTIAASAELYDPAINTWSSAGTLSVGRGAATVTPLGDGRALVAGGASTDVFASAEVYDPAFSRWAGTGSMVTPRQQHAAVLLADGRVLVIGGRTTSAAGGGILASAELYDPSAGRWSATGSMSVARAGASAVVLREGRVLVTGGTVSATGTAGTAAAEIYQPASGRWTATGSLDAPRVGGTMTLLPDGTVLVAGGVQPSQAAGSAGVGPPSRGDASAEVFDPSTGRWSPTGSLRTGRFGHSATLLRDGRVLVAGGASGVSPDMGIAMLDSVEIYDPATRSWSPGPALAHARFGHVAQDLRDGGVLVAGGGAPGGDTLGAEVYR